MLQARLINYSKTKVDYSSKTDNPDFHVEKNTQPATSGGVGGTEVTIEVTYEPSQLGDSKGTLAVSSGNYHCQSQGFGYLTTLVATSWKKVLIFYVDSKQAAHLNTYCHVPLK